jgi:GntR family transcriptional regulator/MocR family aminotransferase
VSIQWAGLAPELLVRIDRERPQPLRAQLEHELRDAIRSGRLPEGERLPSSRQLAAELGLSRGLVLECYTQLQAEGYLVARAGSATRVAGGARVEENEGPREPVATAPSIDFRSGRPDLSSFPRRDWLWALRDVSRTAPADELGYGDSRGNARLRQVLAGYLNRVRGAVATPERIVVCAGFAQGRELLVRVLAGEGVARMAFEDPGHPEQFEAVERWGIEAVPVPVDERGIVIEALAASGARAVLLTPAHQSPTGVVLAPDRRQALVEWAEDVDATILEDDYDAEFRYDREPVGALQGLAPERVAALGTVSKSLAPSIRLGWIVCPPRHVDAVAAEKDLADRGSPSLDQLGLATLIESGRFDRHLRRMRGIYGAKRQALIEALAHHAPAVELGGLAAGFHAVARLPDGVDPDAVAAAAAERSVGLYPMSEYRALTDPRPPELVLGFGNLTEGAIDRGIANVADLLSGSGGD